MLQPPLPPERKPNRHQGRRYLAVLLILAVPVLAGTLGKGLRASPHGASKSMEEGMTEIRFDLGKNIVDTARASGVPAFANDNIDGYISYSFSPVPDAVVAHYTCGFRPEWTSIPVRTGHAAGADRGRLACGYRCSHFHLTRRSDRQMPCHHWRSAISVSYQSLTQKLDESLRLRWK